MRFFVDNDGDAVALVFAVGLLVEAFVEVQRVIETAATTSGDTDSQHHVVAEVMFFLKPLDFLSGSLGQFNCHGWMNLFIRPDGGVITVEAIPQAGGKGKSCWLTSLSYSGPVPRGKPQTIGSAALSLTGSAFFPLSAYNMTAIPQP